MNIIEISADEYGNIIGGSVPIFSKPEFLELNSNKVDKIHYLLGKDNKNRVAFAIGDQL